MSTEVVHSVVVQPASRLSTFQSTVNYHADVLWIGYPEDRVEGNMTSMLFTFPSKKISFMNMRAFDVSCVLSGMSSSVSPNVWHTQSASMSTSSELAPLGVNVVVAVRGRPKTM
jgi:hypothetical protein